MDLLAFKELAEAIRQFNAQVDLAKLTAVVGLILGYLLGRTHASRTS